MKEDPLLEEKRYWADVTFKNLTGLTKAKDSSLEFYAMVLGKQEATAEGFKKFSWMFADSFIEAYMKKNNQNMTENEIEKLIKKSLKSAWKKYNG
jgi:hypothetical protein